MNHIPGIHDNGPRDHELWRRTLTAYKMYAAQSFCAIWYFQSSCIVYFSLLAVTKQKDPDTNQQSLLFQVKTFTHHKQVCSMETSISMLIPIPFHAPFCLTHSEQRPQNIYSQEEMSLYCIIKWQQKFLYFHYKSVKLDVLGRQNKIWKFRNPFQTKKLPICTLSSDLQSLYMLPIWGFADYFA